MQNLRTLIISVMLATTGLLMPSYCFAQQIADSPPGTKAEDTVVFTDRNDRDQRDGARRGSEDGGTAQNGGSVNVQVVAAADERTNSVIVRGPGEILDLVAEVLAALDSTTTQIADVRVFQLRYADAMNTANVINQLFGEEQSSSQSNQRGGFFGPTMFRGPGGSGRTDQQDGGQAQVVAAADSQTNTVVVAGPENLLEVVAEVVKNLDSQIPNVADVKVYHLEYADAQDTAELINEVFGESRTSSQSTRSSGQQNQAISFRGVGPGSRGGQQPAMDSAGGISDVAIIAAADSRTNSVVVSGPAETLEIITGIVKELDENPEQERQIFLYSLKNANAENLMTILNNLFAEMAALNDEGAGTTGQVFQGSPRGTQPTGGQASDSSNGGGDDLSEETYFEADIDTNTLLVLTSSKNYKKIKPTLEDLDKPIPQVLIKVLFAEVTHSDTIDLGVEFSMLNISDGDSVLTTQVFGGPSPLSYQGGAASSTGLAVRTIEGDLDLTIRALQESGRLNVLSRPYILCSNNQLATITIGEEVPIPTGTTEVAGQSQTTIDYRDDIGIVLNVTPSINPDGLVSMNVNPRITTRSAESVAITETLNAEAFSTRSADTKVTVRDGQTIVIGGLIEDQLKDTIKKIPLLGDIPIMGNLFKRTAKEKTKTELLIFLTPHVAQDAAGLTPISEAERARSILNTDERAGELFKKHIEAMDAGASDVNEP